MTTKNETKKGLKLGRREFLGLAWAASLLALPGQAALVLLNFVTPRIKPGGFGSKIEAGTNEEFEPGTVSYVQKGRFYISRLDNGGLLAIWQRCPHLGCTVPWKEDEGMFHCPCHSSLFDRTGEIVSGPAPRSMDLFPISIAEGKVIVDTSQPLQRQAFDPTQVIFSE